MERSEASGTSLWLSRTEGWHLADQRHKAGRTISNAIAKNKRTVPATTKRSTAASGSFLKLIASVGAHDSSAAGDQGAGRRQLAFRFHTPTAPAAPCLSRSKDHLQVR